MASQQGKKVGQTPTTRGVSFTSALVVDYRDDDAATEYDAFRTVITVPTGTREVELWAEESTRLMVHGQWHTIDASKGIVVAPNGLGKVVLTIEAEDVATSALMVRTNTMGQTERYYVFPDTDAHRKLSALDDDALHDNREALGIDSKYGKQDCQNVAQALKNLADTVRMTYDPSTGGLGKYENVAPEQEEHAHWMVEEQTEEPTYKRLTSAEADAARKGLARVGGELGQGKKKKKKKKKGLGKSIKKTGKKAGKSTSKAASSATKTTTKATTSAVKTTGKAVTSAANTAAKTTKKVVHGDLIDAADITPDMAKIDGLARNGAKAMAKVLREGTTQTMVLAVKIGGETLNFVIDTAQSLGKVIKNIIAKIGANLAKFVNWLADLLGWHDILHTQKILRDSCNKALDFFVDTTQTAKEELRGLIDSLDKTLNKQIDKLIDKYGGGIRESKQRKDPIPSAVSDKIEWLLDQFSGSKDKGGSGDDVDENKTKSIKDVIGDFVNKVGSDPELKDALSGALDQFVRIFEKPAQAPDLTLGIVLNLIKAMLNVALELVEAVISLTLDLAKELIKLLRKLLNTTIKIPVISKLFKVVTKGEKLTLLNFITLLVAIPANLLGKALGSVPFEGRGALGQSMSQEEWQTAQACHDWGIIYGVVQLLGMYLVTSDYAEDPAGWITPVNLTLGVIAQVAGFPTGYPCFEGWSWSSMASTMANFIWLYQWDMWICDVAMWKSKVSDDDEKTILSVTNEALHLCLFIALVALIEENDELSQDDRLDTCCCIDPLPGIFTIINHSALKPYELETLVIGPAIGLKLAYGACYLSATVDHYKNAKQEYKSGD